MKKTALRLPELDPAKDRERRLRQLREAEVSHEIEGMTLHPIDAAVLRKAIEEGLSSDEMAARVRAHLVRAESCRGFAQPNE